MMLCSNHSQSCGEVKAQCRKLVAGDVLAVVLDLSEKHCSIVLNAGTAEACTTLTSQPMSLRPALYSSLCP